MHSLGKEYLEKVAQGGPGQVLQNVRQAVSNRLLSRISEEALVAYLEQLETVLGKAQAELAVIDQEWLASGWQRCSEALRELRQPVKEQARHSVEKLQSGLELLHLAQKMSGLRTQALTWQQI